MRDIYLDVHASSKLMYISKKQQSLKKHNKKPLLLKRHLIFKTKQNSLKKISAFYFIKLIKYRLIFPNDN